MGAWFILFDYSKVWNAGIHIFRDPKESDWTLDVGSAFWRDINKCGFKNFNLNHREANRIDYYDKFIHYGGVSWDLSRPEHASRYREIYSKLELIRNKSMAYSDITLESKFIT